jgi:arsenate reductase
MKILFICTHNRCRSILSEAITNHLANGRIQAFSAGSQPVGQVHPLSLKYLELRGIATEGLQSQSWDDFESIAPEVVVTVCDSAASEACPVWFGDTLKVHWGLPDPSKLTGSDDDIQAAFFAVMDTIGARIEALLALDFEAMPPAQLQAVLNTLAKEV